MPRTIGDLIPGTNSKLGNRTDLVDRIPFWLRDALLELTESYAFEELRVTGPQVALSVPAANQQATYPLYLFMNPGDLNMTQVIAVSYFVNYPSNNVIRELDYRVPAVVDSLGCYQSIPVYWTRLGNTITVAPPPQQPYTMWFRYQRQHPINDSGSDNGSVTALNTTPVLVPASWWEIVEYSAALRAATELRSDDYATRFHNILFGDPEYAQSGGVRGRPGLIAARTFQNQRDSSNNTRRLGVQINRYSRA